MAGNNGGRFSWLFGWRASWFWFGGRLGNGRYQLHPLLHDFAQSLSVPEGAQERFLAYWAAFVVENRLDYETLAGEMGHIEAALATAGQKKWLRPLHTLLENLMPFWLVRGAYVQAARYLAEAERLNDDQALRLVQANLAGLVRQRGRSPSTAAWEHLKVFI